MAKTDVSIKDEYTELMEQRKILAAQRKETNAKIAQLKEAAAANLPEEQKVIKRSISIWKQVLKHMKESEYSEAHSIVTKQLAREIKEAMSLPSAK